MFKSDEFEVDDLFKSLERHGHSDGDGFLDEDSFVMNIVLVVACVVGAAIALGLLYRCCCAGSRGRVLRQAAPAGEGAVPAPYPQQQYSAVTVTAIPATVGHNAVPYPAVGGPYPVAAPYPTVGATYPTAGAPYHNAAASYPTAGVPYPNAGAPYPPAGAPYPTAMPQPSSAPSAPDAHTLPPSYDQVMCNEAKHPPYNPYAPH